MHIGAADRVLEIGCGAGLAIGVVASSLRGGSITALDRSAAMVAKAAKRNEAYLVEGRAVLHTGELSDINWKASTFDKVFAFNVNVFLGQATKELAIIQPLLRPRGQLFLFFQPPPGTTRQVLAEKLEKASANLLQAGYSIIDTSIENMEPAPCCAVWASL